jgi:alpha-glucoside transport system substrate-binding protein
MKLKKVFYLLILLALILPAGASSATAQDATLKIMGSWLASEADAFEYVLDGFRESTGIEVEYEGVDELIVPLTTRVAAGSPPDLAILPVANGLKDLQGQGALLPLDPFMDEINASFDQGWIDQFTIDGNVYAIPTRANASNLLWYNPATIGGEVPTSWSEFLAFCDGVAADGGYCTAGIANTTFTLSILFEDTYLSAYGPEMWNALMTGEIPWTDPTVVEAVNRCATFYSDKYTAGGSTGALGTGLVDGIARVFGENPDATFVAGGSWVSGIVSGAINENIVEGETIDYVVFPGEPVSKGSIIAAADVAVMFVDSPESRALMSYLISAEGQARFAPNGYPVANKNVDPALYTGLAAKSAGLLANSVVAPSTGAAMSNEMRSQLIEIIGAAILDPDNIELLLEELG